MNYISNRFLFFILLFISLLPLVGIYADGSKDLYPSGTTGNRAYLRSNTGVTENWPFPNRGTHFVYAEVGETITLASSAQSGTTKRIRLYAPTGNEVTLTVANNQGNIADRNAELAGPRRVGQAAGDNRYLPIYYTVPAGAAGIYKVEFDGTGNNSGSVTGGANSLSQPSNSSYVAGWDVSVINTTNTDFIKGRVYTNVLNMSVASSTTTGFYGLVYVLTKDGYTYRVNNNGNNGIYFTFFVNNNGFVNATTKVPIYKSLNTTTGIGNQVHDPNLADTDVSITHKLFYTQPSADLPLDVEVSGAVPGGKTWLKNTIVVPKVEEVKVLGTDNTEGQISSKGGYIRFRTESQGTFTIKIESTGTPAFTTRHMYGAAKIGENSVYWDGKDGDNIPIPAGHVPAKITVQLQGAEVHFPFFDMEMNLRGTIIELLDHNNLNNVLSDVVYWDDSNITINSNNNSGSSPSPVNNTHLPPTNSSGISSNSNGHKWAVGISNASYGFGNEKSIDTWTFIKGEEKTIETAVTIKEADLQVSSVTVDKSSVRLEEEDINGDYNPTILSYTVKVKNNGPSDVVGAPFTFTLPKGFDGTGYTAVFNGNGCGTESLAIVYDAVKRQYSSSLNLPDGCEITYTFQAKVTLDADPGNNNAVATILRPNDVTDPDATNTSDPANPVAPANAENPYDLTQWYVLPTDPYFECANNGKGGNCNNIKGVMVNLIRETDLAIEKTVNEPKPKVGDFVTFTLKITNYGPHNASNIIIEDILPNGYTLGSINNGGTSAGNTITWNITSLAKEANISVSFTAKVNASGSYLNTASVSGEGVDPDLTNNQDTERVNVNNFWHGTIDNDWAKTGNWTADYIPQHGENIEFATTANNNGSPAVRDLYLDTDRVIGDLINNSDMDLLVTTENQLTINGVVRDDNPAKGTIVVKASTDKPTGTLFFADPDNNRNVNVNATVEFYNKAYECSTCGFYKNQWQYFGIPVQASGFPYLTPKVETINQWVEPFSGNKWQPAPYTPDTGLKAFKGYEMTNSSNTLPTHIYSFPGTLNVGNAVVPLTRTSNVNYSGMNLVGNSFTAAIPITSTAIELGSVELTENTVYLFNTGTRDQWRKLNGGTVSGVAGGQYQAVPFNLAGQAGIPDRILSMHTFMLDVKTPGNITLKYGELIKNELNTSTTKPWKSAYTESRTPQYPYIVMDVVSNTSADRVWLFENSNTTKGFDNGWDAYKLQEEGLTQVYVSDEAESKYQIATVPEFTGTTFGVNTVKEEKFSITLSVTSDVEMRKLYLHDIHTGRSYPIGNNEEYTFSGANTITNGRFKITESSSPLTGTGQESSLVNIYVRNNQIVVDNQSDKNCVATVYDILGRLLDEKKVFSNSGRYFVGSQLINKGIYIVKIVSEDKSISKSERVLLK